MREITGPTYWMSYNEFDGLVRECLNIPKYDVIAWNELNNDTDIYEEGIDGKTDHYYTDSYEAGEFEELSIGFLLNKLCSSKVIPSGNYVINVCW